MKSYSTLLRNIPSFALDLLWAICPPTLPPKLNIYKSLYINNNKKAPKNLQRSLVALNTHFWRKCHPPYTLSGFCSLSDSWHQIFFFILLWFFCHHQRLLLLAVPKHHLLLFISDQHCIDAAVGGRYHHQHAHHAAHHPSYHHCDGRSTHTHGAVALAHTVSC